MNIEKIKLPDGNVLLVDKSRPAKINEICYDPVFKSVLRGVNGIVERYHLLASKVEIDPSIPLFREEDLKGKDRYYLQKGVDVGYMESSMFWIEARFQGKNAYEMAEKYCKSLNSKHEQVDVEELAKNDCIENAIYPSIHEEESKYWIEAFINGFNANKQGGYNEGDMIRAVRFGYDWERGEGEAGKYQKFSFDTALEEYLNSKKPLTTIKLKQENGVIVTQEIDGKQYVIFE